MSKADTAGTQGDRQRVLMQITQDLCKRQGLNRAGFDMPTIFIPSLTEKVWDSTNALYCIVIYLQTTCDNHIDEVCETITKTIDRNIQNTLNTLEKDAETISSLFHDKLNSDRLEREREEGEFDNRSFFILGKPISLTWGQDVEHY